MNDYKSVIYKDKKYWPPFLIKAITYIENNYSQKLSIAEIAKDACMSKYHFCRVFKKSTEQTVIEYLNSVRIEKAKDLLKNSSFSITEISFKVGFNNISHFNCVFKKAVGITPSSCRRDDLE